MQTLEETTSICPTCFYKGTLRKIQASIIEENGSVWVTKECPQHGFFKELFFSDGTLYNRWMRFKVTGKPVPYVKTSVLNDPQLYGQHLSQTVLTNLVVTNRNNLGKNHDSANATRTDHVYEPSLDQLRDLMQQTRLEKPLGSTAIQLMGGEPTLRRDFIDIIRSAKNIGFSHVQVYTNGRTLAESVEYCHRLKDERVDSIYLRFDGVTNVTNPLLKEHRQALENLKKVKLPVVLAPVLVGRTNVLDAGKIVRFAFDNIDIVRGVHFQSTSYCEANIAHKDNQRESQQVDVVQVIEAIEKEFPGMISRDDFYPISFVFPISKLVEAFTREPQVEFSAHPGCGGSTFIFMKDGKPVPITRFYDVEGYMAFLDEQTKKKGPFRKLRIASALLKNIDTFVDSTKAPPGFNVKQILKEAAIGGSSFALRKFHHQYMFIGLMWYQNPWNIHFDRLQRCVVHCPTFEGIIPFCTYIGLGYGERIQKKYSIPLGEWEKRTGRRLEEDAPLCVQ